MDSFQSGAKMKIFYFLSIIFGLMSPSIVFADDVEDAKAKVQERLKYAIELIEKKDYEKFLTECADPNELKLSKKNKLVESDIKSYNDSRFQELLPVWKSFHERGRLGLERTKDQACYPPHPVKSKENRVTKVYNLVFNKVGDQWYISLIESYIATIEDED